MKDKEAIEIIQHPEIIRPIEVYIIVKLGSGIYDVEKTHIIGRLVNKTYNLDYAVTEDYVVLDWNKWFNTKAEARNKLKELE